VLKQPIVVSPHQLKTINKTAVTSKKVNLRQFDHTEVYTEYESSLSNIEGMVRFDIPWEYSTLLGTRLKNPFVLCSIENNVIEISYLGHNDNTFKVPVYYCNDNRRSKKSEIREDEDNQFFLLPKSRVPFLVDQEVTFRYYGDDGESERRFSISIEDDIRNMNYNDLVEYHRNRWSSRTRRFMQGHEVDDLVHFPTTLKWWNSNDNKDNLFIYKDIAWFELYPNVTCVGDQFVNEEGYISWTLFTYENAPKGIGTELSEAVHSKIKELGFSKVRVMIHKDNKACIHGPGRDYELLSEMNDWCVYSLDL